MYTLGKWTAGHNVVYLEEGLGRESTVIARVYNRSNIPLIAAAPDMSGVLRQFIRYCEQWQYANGEFQVGDGRILILKNAQQALSKVEGELND